MAAKDNLEITPVFVTCDPERDTVEKMAAYVKDFHPNLVGLTGAYDDVYKAAKKYRVYLSKSDIDEEDYLVDHSVFSYLLSPDGECIECYGQNMNAQECYDSIKEYVSQWKK